MNRKKSIITICWIAILVMLCFQMEAQDKPLLKKDATKKPWRQSVPQEGKPSNDTRKDTFPKSNPSKPKPKPIQQEQDTSDVIDLKHADEIEGFNSETESIRFLKGNVVFYQKDAYFYCDSAYLYENQNAIHAWGKVTIIQSDTITMFSDTLKYFGDTKDAYMIGNVVLTDTSRQIFTERLDYNMETKDAIYQTGGLLRDKESQLTSTYGKYNTGTDLAFFRDEVVVINDKFTLKSDSLLYDTKTKQSTFLGPTLILQDSAKIYCESGFYHYENNTAEFNQNPQYISGEKIAVSDKMLYNGDTKMVTLVGNAKFKEGTKNAHSDVMKYNETTDITRLEGNAYFKDEDQEVTADVIIYDGKEGSYTTEGKTISRGKDNYVEADNSAYDKATNTTTLTGNVLVSDSTQILTADLVKFNNETEDAYAKGNVHWQDTVNHVTIKSSELFYNKETEYIKALGRPLMTTVMDDDTLYISADTLISEKVVLDSLDTISQLIGYRNVKMFKSDFQAVCDSLNYNATDSIFNFYDLPILWSDSSQFSADTVRIKLKNENIDSVFLLNKALIIDTPDEQFFNQIKGKRILIKFAEGKPKKMDVNGNAESVYYIQDDDGGYVGPNKTACSDMYLYFEKGELQIIRYLVEPTQVIYPMKQANHNEMRLPGFKWESKKRPQSPADLDSPFYIMSGTELLINQENKKLDDEIIREEQKEAATMDDTISEKEISSDAPSDIPEKTTPDLKNIRNKVAKPKKNDE